MEINWLGHSCFRLKGAKTTVITDPYSPKSGYNIGKPTASIVTISHPHPEHSNAAVVGGPPRLVKGPGEYEIGGVLVVGIPTFHDNEKGAVKGKNTIYLFEIDEMTVCHLGDLGHTLNAEQAEELGDIDILMVPVGGDSTIDGSKAAEVVRQLEPKIVIPMHYKTPALKRELAPVDKFLTEMGAKDIAALPKLNVNKGNLPLITEVRVLNYWLP